MDSKKTMKIGKILLIILLAWLLLTFIRWITSHDIHDATINLQSGNISILNNDYELKTYDVSGQLLSTTNIDLYDNSGGYAALACVDGKLYVAMHRTDVIYMTEASGEMVVVDEIPFDANNPSPWDEGWEKDGKGWTYATEKTVYKYNYPSFWRYLFGDREISFAITDIQTQETVVIWSFDEK